MHHPRLSFLFCVTLLLQSATTFTIADDCPQLETKIQELMQKHHAVGLAICVVKEGEIIYSKAFGEKDVETHEPLEIDDLFRIASISKSFSATSIMQLVEKGKLKLDDPVSELVGFPVMNPHFPETTITLEMLLSHTSSINDSEGYYYLSLIDPQANKNSENCYSDYEPGSKYAYCNLNYNMVGTIIERVSGERFDQYVKKHVLEPLQLTGGYWIAELDPEKFVTLYKVDTETGQPTPENDAYAYNPASIDNYQFGYSTPMFSPTGGMKISATDLAKYMIMHMNYGQQGDVEIISEESSRRMQTPFIPSSDYGFALKVSDKLIPGKRTVGHTGSAYGLFSLMHFQPDEKFGFVVITNGCDRVYKDDFMELLGDSARLAYEQFIQN